ncbi:MAG: DUF2155 domain-containing protein [Hyphomicrobiaceae bacterium]
MTREAFQRFIVARGTCGRSRVERAFAIGLALGLGWLTAAPANAQRIENPVAVFAALDKVTARISTLEVPINSSVDFGSLTVTPRACYTRAPTEPPRTTGFIEVMETRLDGTRERIFSGWMFAESPGLHAVEHPVFDVWLTGCSGGALPAEATATSGTSEADAPRRRVRR